MILVHIKCTYDYKKIEVNLIQKSDIIEALSNTQEDECSYVVQEHVSLEELKKYDKDDMIEFLYDVEITGNVIAKYSPFDIS